MSEGPSASEGTLLHSRHQLQLAETLLVFSPRFLDKN